MTELRRADPMLQKILPPQKTDPGQEYCRSRYALPFEYEGETLWFHTLTRQLVRCSRPLPEKAAGSEVCSDAEWAALARGYFLVPEGKDECAFYLGLFRIMHAMVRKKGIKGYTILPTTACNARCVYCYEAGRKQETMTPETVEKTVEFIRETGRKDGVILAWFGGEPLAAVPVIDAITAKVRAAGIPFTGSVTTNGSLITESLARKMAEDWKIRFAQVSMDGDEADYTARKRYIAEGDFYHKVLNAVRLLAEKGVRVSVRCNVDEENIGVIGSFLSDLARAVPDRKNVDVYLSALNDVRTGEGSLEIWRKIAGSGEMIRAHGFQTGDSRFTLYDFRSRHCMADMGSVVIGPDGGVYACEHCSEDSRYGNLVTGEFDREAENRFRAADRVRGKCRDCPFLPECTPFASCPVQDAHCREIRELRFAEKLRAFLDSDGLEEPEKTQVKFQNLDC